MGDFAYLTIGTKHRLTSMKYQIPHTWCIIFDNIRPKKGVCEIDVCSAKEKLHFTGLTLDNLEEQISKYTGWDAKHWKRYRKFVRTGDNNALEKRLRQEGFKQDDEGYRNVLDLLDTLEVDDGLFELVALYKLLLALEDAAPRQKVRLDLRDFESYYDDFSEILSDAKRNFIDKVSMYDYLFAHTIPDSDQVKLVLNRIQVLNEDELIDQVLIPLFSKMGYQNVTRIAYHGPTESGLDVPLFYELDKFNSRIYYGAQVKAINIHTNSRREGHAESISNQLSLALDSTFIDQEDNEEKQIDKIMLVTSKNVHDTARKVLHQKFPRILTIIDGKKLAEWIVKYSLVERILHTSIHRRHLKAKNKDKD